MLLYKVFFKRFIDIFATLIAISLLILPLLVVCIFSTILMGRPIMFKQKRIGYKEKEFFIYKFRTMTNCVDEGGKFLSDGLRLTKYGKFLRASSLDELPGLLNVLKGEMSLVGPRPLLVEYLPLYSDEQSVRHTVLPGVSGWAQVKGRNAISWKEKFELDSYYIKNMGFIFDMKILLLTVIKVVKKDGIAAQNHVTMKKFTGNEDE